MKFGSALAGAWLAATLLAGSAAAQGVEELVVTASRLSEYDPAETPSITLTKRADNLITKVTVICDTRDQSQRRSELRATLRNLIRMAAQDKSITLGIGDEVVTAFDETMLDSVIEPDAKADTSRATLLIKTAVSSSDSFDAATGRIKAFVEKTPKVGRTEVLLNSSWELTLIGPAKYRPDVIKLVSEDAQRVAAAFGAGYGVEVQGLQLPVSWYQSGPLDLALYIPYRLTVRPVTP
jgi:hypothetical protein